MTMRLLFSSQPGSRVLLLLWLLCSGSQLTLVSSLTTTTAVAAKNTDSSFRGAVYQCQPQQAQKQPSLVLYNLERITDALQRAANHYVELVVFPEEFLNDSNHPLDREASELSVIGQLAQAFQVACVVPFVEKQQQQQAQSGDTPEFASSSALFHADGSRAGTYQCITKSYNHDNKKSNNNAFVESLPIRLDLKSTSISCGIMMGQDVWTSPEHGRHLLRLGAQLLLVSSKETNARIMNHVLTSRALENQVPVLCANWEGAAAKEDASSSGCYGVGLSCIISPDGEEWIRAPIYKAESSAKSPSEDRNEEEGDHGRVVVGVEGSSIIPCQGGGELYVCNIPGLAAHGNTHEGGNKIVASSSSSLPFIEQSKTLWEITPKQSSVKSLSSKQPGEEKTDKDGTVTDKKKKKGFGSAKGDGKYKSKRRKQ